MKDFARARAKDCMRSRTSHGLKVIRMCTRARLAGATHHSCFCFTLLLTSQRTLLLLDKERRHRSQWLTPADSCVSNDSEEEAQQGARRVIIPEPPGLELPGLPDFLPPRSVETEARVVQRGVTANAGRPLRPRFKEMKGMRSFSKTLCPKKSARSFPNRGACLFQLERKVEERESDAVRSRSFHVIRLQESELPALMSAKRPQGQSQSSAGPITYCADCPQSSGGRALRTCICVCVCMCICLCICVCIRI